MSSYMLSFYWHCRNAISLYIYFSSVGQLANPFEKKQFQIMSFLNDVLELVIRWCRGLLQINCPRIISVV